MENKLKKLFDYQDFEGNNELQAVIDSVHQRYQVREVSLEDMDLVWAAGVPDPDPRKDQKKELHK